MLTNVASSNEKSIVSVRGEYLSKVEVGLRVKLFIKTNNRSGCSAYERIMQGGNYPFIFLSLFLFVFQYFCLQVKNYLFRYV